MKLRDYAEIGIGIVLLYLIAGAFLYGIHIGKQNGAETLAKAQKDWAQTQNQSLQLAMKSQAMASASHIAALQIALAQANADNTAQARDLSQAKQAETVLKNRLNAVPLGSIEAIWLTTPIPPKIAADLCTVDDAGQSSPQCP